MDIKRSAKRNTLNLFSGRKATYLPAVICIGILLMTAAGCSKEEINFSIIPKIAFVGITPLQVQEYTDRVTITISYEDGNGDI